MIIYIFLTIYYFCSDKNWILFPYFQATASSGYAYAGFGHCNDWVYLPEGAYPALLAESNSLYNVDRIQECVNRCVYAADNGLTGFHSHGDPKISDLAFYVVESDGRCACSSGACSTLTPDPTFRSYYISSGKFEGSTSIYPYTHIILLGFTNM